MRLIVMLFWGFVLYMIFRAVMGFLRQIARSGNQRQHNNNFNNNRTENGGEVNNKKYNINKNDIVDADFVEIKPEDEKKTEK